MLTRRVRIQVAIFLVIAVAGIGYTGFRYAGLQSLFGRGGMVVKLQLADSGGIFTNADVTYRGVTIGKVGDLNVVPDGTEVELVINDGAPAVPADVEAVVANRSAVGEQYVDLRPRTSNGPFLTEGSTIKAKDTVTPVPLDQLLGNVDALAASVPTGSLKTVVDELYNAFNGAGPDLRTVLDSTSAFAATAKEYLPATKDLLSSARTVLTTQNAEAGNLRSFSSDLRLLAGELKKANPNLDHFIRAVPPVSAELSGLLAETGPGLGKVIANLLTTADILGPRTSGLENILATYPVLTAAANTVVPGDGTAHLGLVLNFFDPLVCTKGYQGTRLRPADQVAPRPANPDLYCAEPPGSPTSVRGAQNAPYGGTPRRAPSAPGTQQQPGPAGSPAPLPGLAGLTGISGPTDLAGLLGLPR
ncbi:MULTISPECIES: MlaD family protein [Amycolatopsis methanolica group]|uniref:MlaD family protein n=1 Tax=Amycolatopsis methanolica group TaxID=2893674 RepID=UPI0034225B09